MARLSNAARTLADAHGCRLVVALLVLVLAVGCTTVAPLESAAPFEMHELGGNAQTKSDGDLRVSVSVLDNENASRVLGVDLASRWIQAIWISVENHDSRPYWLLMPSLDPNYFAPDELAYALNVGESDDDTRALMQRLRAATFRNPVAPGTKVSGLVFVSADLDAKQVDVQLLSARRLAEFVFFLPVRGVNAATLFDVQQQMQTLQPEDVDEDTLRRRLASYPCCTTDPAGTQSGDPLNLVLIGNAEDLFPAFVRRGWHAAEKTYLGSIKHTIGSFLFGQRYIYSPVSPLYVFGRAQDIAFQKARGTIHQRNHLRLWLTPLRYGGKAVWIGQISRDIGVKFTTKSPFLVTHVIDPDVDEARNGLVQDLLFSHELAQVGYVAGIPPSTPSRPASNLTDDPYFCDGLRAVMLLDQTPRTIREVGFFDWDETPPHRHARHLNLSVE
ncbi:MAG: LssY C-terminal domain-containing protein [Gammaproteobacteria bacterium]|nr:LssY C-terminal domain-containing protein [Gammaproteobacteria bacterium]